MTSNLNSVRSTNLTPSQAPGGTPLERDATPLTRASFPANTNGLAVANDTALGAALDGAPVALGSRANVDPNPITAADHLLIAINVVGLGLAALDAYFDLGPWSAYACVLVSSAMYLGHVAWRGTSILKSLLLFGLVAGLTELAADWWLVSITHTLTYTPWGPFLIDSPAYMPMSWAGILLSMGFFGWALHRRYGLGMGMLASTLITGVYVPTYEALAHYAGWWTYSGCSMWGPVPWYIIVGEALIGLSLVPLVGIVLDTKSIWRTILAGVTAGLWIGVAYFIAMRLT